MKKDNLSRIEDKLNIFEREIKKLNKKTNIFIRSNIKESIDREFEKIDINFQDNENKIINFIFQIILIFLSIDIVAKINSKDYTNLGIQIIIFLIITLTMLWINSKYKTKLINSKPYRSLSKIRDSNLI